MGRADLAHEVHVTDVDAELERRGGDERLQRAVLQPMLGVEPNLLRQAAVMRGDRILAEPLAQVPRRPLRHLSRVHEDQRRAVLGDELRQAVVVLLPDLVRHHRVERRARDLDGEVDFAAMPFVDDGAVRWTIAHQELRDFLDRLLRPGEADPLDAKAGLKARLYVRQRTVDGADVRQRTVDGADVRQRTVDRAGVRQWPVVGGNVRQWTVVGPDLQFRPTDRFQSLERQAEWRPA